MKHFDGLHGPPVSRRLGIRHPVQRALCIVGERQSRTGGLGEPVWEESVEKAWCHMHSVAKHRIASTITTHMHGVRDFIRSTQQRHALDTRFTRATHNTHQCHPCRNWAER